MTIGGGILGLIVFVLDIWAIVKIVSSSDSSGAKLLWILLILILPLIGVVIWLIAGSRTRALVR